MRSRSWRKKRRGMRRRNTIISRGMMEEAEGIRIRRRASIRRRILNINKRINKTTDKRQNKRASMKMMDTKREDLQDKRQDLSISRSLIQ